MNIEIGKKVVFKVVAPDNNFEVVSGTIIYYDGLTGIYGIKDKLNIVHYRAINKIWFDFEIARNTTDSGTIKILSLNKPILS
jgi:hypothetical protein